MPYRVVLKHVRNKAVIEVLKNIQKDIASEIFKNDDSNPKVIMEHKILMMGGRRAGKSTILSSILSSLRQTPGAICTILDRTDYTQMIETPKGPIPMPTLDIKQREVVNYMKKKSTNTNFLVDMSPSYGKASYILEVSANGTAINFEFVDVPGEWMRSNVADHNKLKEDVKSSDIFVIAIDTPFLMNEEDIDGSVNEVYNRIYDITQVMANIQIENETDKKQIILCPVKCEKWARNNRIDEVVERVQVAYRDLINRWVDKPEVTIRIMPIQTVGGIESERMLPALLYFKDDEDPKGVSCSMDPNTGMYIDKDGKVLRETSTSSIEEDKAWSIDYVDIPLSWYKLNGAEYSPVYCEQVGYHILKFLVEKEENVIKVKAESEADKLNNYGKLRRWWTSLWKPTFGVYLPKWKEVISQLTEANLIKEQGDGFVVVKNKVN